MVSFVEMYYVHLSQIGISGRIEYALRLVKSVKISENLTALLLRFHHFNRTFFVIGFT